MGFHTSASTTIDRRMDEAFAGLNDFRKILYDVVIFDSYLQRNVQHVRQILSRCEEKKISLNRETFSFAERKYTL